MIKFEGNVFFLIICICFLPEKHDGFYVPGVAPVEFKDGDVIEVKVKEKLKTTI